MTYTVNSFFAGIGGFDLAFEAAGFEITLQVEIDDFCQGILRKHWPDVPKIADIKTATAQNVPYADVFVGGFPCQDISGLGNKLGIREGTRSGLWFEFERIIGEVRPRVVLLENVADVTIRGGTTVIRGFAELGYDVRWGIIRAYDADAFHVRSRWFAFAYDNRQRVQRVESEAIRGKQRVAHENKNVRRIAPIPQRSTVDTPRLCGSRNGVPDQVDRLKALGNAVVPQVVYPLAVMIREWLDSDQR